MVEEDYGKNRIRCSFAAGRDEYTLGFTLASPNTKPMTLLKGKVLDSNKAKHIDLVLRRPSGASSFDMIFFGNIDALIKYKDFVKDILSEPLQLLLFSQENAQNRNMHNEEK